MSEISANAKAIRALLLPGEVKIRLYYPSQGGLRVLPSRDGFMLPEQVPPLLFGKAHFDAFAHNCRPMRQEIPAYLPGAGAESGGARAASPDPQKGQPIDMKQVLAAISALNQGSTPDSEPETDDDDDDDDDSEQDLPATGDPSLDREIVVAQISKVRGVSARQDAETEASVDRERMSVIHGSTYTQEIAEWQQISSRTKQELYRDARRTQELAQRQVEQADYAASAMIRQGRETMEMAELLARRLQSGEFQPPPPPKPQVDYGAVAIAGMTMLTTFAAGLTGLRQPPTTTMPNTERLLSGLSAAAPPSTGQFSITKARLQELADAKALGLYGNSEALAKLIREDKLDKRLGIRAPKDGVYVFDIDEIASLAREGALTLFGDGEKLAELIASNHLQQLLNADKP
jgi:hypothetical protein